MIDIEKLMQDLIDGGDGHGDLNHARANMRAAFGFADLRAQLADERAGCPLLAQATDRINDLEAQLADMREREANRWISVEDRLPDKQGEYLCCINGWAIPRVEFYHIEKRKFVTCDWVRYWRPLPAMPTEQKPSTSSLRWPLRGEE